MNLPRISVQRPIFTTMVTLIVIVMGVASLSPLRIDLLPNVEMPTLTVATTYDGASPEVMERLVTQIIEEIIATVPGVEKMESTSSEDQSNVRVTFAWGIDIDDATAEVRSRLEDEQDELPDEVNRPQIRKFDVNSFPVVQAQQLRLLRLIDAPLNLPDVVTSGLDALNTELPNELKDSAGRVQLALRVRPDLNEARLRLEQNRLETIRTRDGLLPRLELFAALGKTGYDDTFSGSFEELDGDTYDFALGVRFSQVLGRTTARGENRLALVNRDRAAMAVHNLEQLIELDVLLADNEVRRSRDQIRASQTTRELQELTAEAEEERFKAGSSTTLLVAQAQRDLLESQIAEVESLIAFRVALIQAHLAEGTLLERRGISIAD